MKMTLRWFGKDFDSVTLQQIRQIPGVTGVITTYMIFREMYGLLKELRLCRQKLRLRA